MQSSRFVREVDRSALPLDHARWFIVAGDQLVVFSNGDSARIPDSALLTELGVQPQHAALLGYDDGVACFVAELAATDLPSPLRLIGLRQAMVCFRIRITASPATRRRSRTGSGRAGFVRSVLRPPSTSPANERSAVRPVALASIHGSAQRSLC